MLADNSAFYTTAYPTRLGEQGPNPCALVEVAASGAANYLATRGVPAHGLRKELPAVRAQRL